MAVTYIKLNQLSVVKSNVSISNGVYAGGLPVKPVVSVVVNGVTLKEGQDYDLDVSSNTDVANATISNSLDVTVKPKKSVIQLQLQMILNSNGELINSTLQTQM